MKLNNAGAHLIRVIIMQETHEDLLELLSTGKKGYLARQEKGGDSSSNDEQDEDEFIAGSVVVRHRSYRLLEL